MTVRACATVRVAAWTLTIVAIGAVVGGCASTDRLAPLPVVDPGIASKVVVIRVSSLFGAAVRNPIALNGADLFRIGSGEHAEFAIPPGEHRIAVRCFGGWSPTWKEDTRTFTAVSGVTTYFRISPSMSCAEIIVITAGDATRLLADSTALDLAVPR
jgi:hypothetical protein